MSVMGYGAALAYVPGMACGWKGKRTMNELAVESAGGAAASRAIYYSPQKAFDRPVAPILPVVFAEQRARAFDPACPSGFVACDLSVYLGSDWPASTPTMLARYVVIRAGEAVAHTLQASGLVYYVLRGAGTAQCGDESFAWGQRDSFCMPGGEEVALSSEGGAILMVFTDEPLISYLRGRADPAAGRRVAPALFTFDRVEQGLRDVHGQNGEQLAAGKSVLLVTEPMAARKLATPGLLASYNSLEAGGDQRPHLHCSGALTLSIAGEGVHSQVDGVAVPWEPDTLIVTPPYAEHSHHNRGPEMMLSFVVQDTALYTELRTLHFEWTDQEGAPTG